MISFKVIKALIFALFEKTFRLQIVLVTGSRNLSDNFLGSLRNKVIFNIKVLSATTGFQ